MPRALISVYDKTGVLKLAKGLAELGYEIISTGGTYNLLKDNSVEVTQVSEITEFPEILGGRVKTLHPNIHGGILAKGTPEHLKELQNHNIKPIDLVVVNLYPFEETINKPGVTLDDALENIDIGGPTMVRAAAKNFPRVAVVVNPDKYQQLLELLKEKGEIPLDTRKQLAGEAFAHTAKYDSMITNYLQDNNNETDPSSTMLIDGINGKELRYGENPHQKAYIYSLHNKGMGIADVKPIQGKTLSYNNYLDTHAAWGLVQEFDKPAAVIVKHNNPCGAAQKANLLDAYEAALACDPVSAFGGIVTFNKKIEADLASKLVEVFYEVIAAPEFSKEALQILSTKSNLRLLSLGEITDGQYEIKSIGNSLLVQEFDKKIIDYSMELMTETSPTNSQKSDLLFANRVVKWVKSNAIVVVKDGATIGIGAGQMNRVGSAKIALEQAGSSVKGAVIGSDAFFPFADSIELAAKYGISAIIQPGGSMKDEEVIAKCNELGIAMAFTGTRHFKH